MSLNCQDFYRKLDSCWICEQISIPIKQSEKRTNEAELKEQTWIGFDVMISKMFKLGERTSSFQLANIIGPIINKKFNRMNYRQIKKINKKRVD